MSKREWAASHLAIAGVLWAETGQLTVTDHRPDPAGDGGLLWSNTVIVTPTTRELQHGRQARPRIAGAATGHR
jgi:hypothetical protein